MNIKQIVAILALGGYLIVLSLWLIGNLSNGTGAVLMGTITIVMVLIGCGSTRSSKAGD